MFPGPARSSTSGALATSAQPLVNGQLPLGQQPLESGVFLLELLRPLRRLGVLLGPVVVMPPVPRRLGNLQFLDDLDDGPSSMSFFWPCRTFAMTCSGVCLHAITGEFPPVSVLGHETHIVTGLRQGDRITLTRS